MEINTKKEVKGYVLSELQPQVLKEFAPFCRKVAADSAVLLKNENNVLPLKNNQKVSVFGRIQFDYYKSGTGSGGAVNVDYVTNIIDSLAQSDVVTVNDELKDIYKNWVSENPFYKGVGWASEPWSQNEMPLSAQACKDAAANSDVALVIIGRTAGEDQDNKNEAGSYLLSDLEHQMLKNVSEAFEKVCVVLNVGNIIDMGFMDLYKIDSVIYVWHGGMEGGVAAVDVLTGKVNPSGKLSGTIAFDIKDYPANDNFGDKVENLYVEDIYVGYRYFETFCPEKVRYPFGFGLSYTTFDIEAISVKNENSQYIIEAKVTNTGSVSGKEAVQIYFSAPQGKLGKPKLQLAAFKKTKLINPGESEVITITFPFYTMSSFDDSGVTGNLNCYVMEAGVYEIYLGNSVRNIQKIDAYSVSNDVVIEKLEEALAPVKNYNRIKPIQKGSSFEVGYENVPTRQIDLNQRVIDRRPNDIEITGDKGFKLIDVVDNKCTMEQFVAQLSVDDLICIVKGEGMNSNKVTAGSAGAIGGVTDSLLDFGIPVLCVTDGPSGIRLDSGQKATSMPNGTALACTFDEDLIEELHIFEGIELRGYSIDALLGPGINIHRHPLNGRNFEYFSEDPILTGKMAAAAARGLEKVGPTATIKHFAANNQEVGRSTADSVISQRALREIYLKGFEISVKEGKARAIMTSYNPLNGFWCAGNYDLNTTILRNEWGYQGFVMSDWWAKMNVEGEEAFKTNLKQMVRAQNDIWMVAKNVKELPDNIKEGIDEGYLTVGELQRCATNLLEYIIKSPNFEKFVLGGCVRPNFESIDDIVLSPVMTINDVKNGNEYDFKIDWENIFAFELNYIIDADVLAQFKCNAFINGQHKASFTLSGTEGNSEQTKFFVELPAGNHKIQIQAEDRLVIKELILKV